MNHFSASPSISRRSFFGRVAGTAMAVRGKTVDEQPPYSHEFVVYGGVPCGIAAAIATSPI